MSSRVQVFKENFSVDRNVKIITKTGHAYEGTVIQSKDDHFRLRDAENNESFIFFEDIQSGQIVNNTENTSAIPQPVPTKPVSVETPAPQIVETPTLPDKATVQDVDPDIMRRLIEIEVRFDNAIENALIWVAQPKLDVPTQDIKPYRSYTSTWESVKNRYESAVKNDKSRIPGIAMDLKSLVDAVPSVLSLKRVLAYMQYETDKLQDALKCYQEISLLSQDIDDWYDVAAVASVLSDKGPLECFALHKLLKGIPLTDEIDAWHCYVGMLKASGDYILLEDLLKARERSPEEQEHLLAAAIYGLKHIGKEGRAHEVLRLWMDGSSEHETLQKSLQYFSRSLSLPYLNVEKELTAIKDARVSNGQASPSPDKQAATIPKPVQTTSLQGYICMFKASDHYGFLRDNKEVEYYFQRRDVYDRELFAYLGKIGENRLNRANWIPVFFDMEQGPKGPKATHIYARASLPQVSSTASLQDVVVYNSSNSSASLDKRNGSTTPNTTVKTTPDEVSSQTVDKSFVSAKRFAREGNYSQAIQQIKYVLSVNAEHPEAQQLYEEWRRKASLSSLPSGSTYYGRATRARYAKEFDEAVALYYQAIEQNDPQKETAVKDLASLLLQLNKAPEAVAVLNKYRPQMTNKPRIDNLLIQAHQKAHNYQEAIKLVKEQFNFGNNDANKRADLAWQIATNYLRLSDYVNAREWFELVIHSKIEWRMIGAQSYLALCLINLGEYMKAEEILSRIVKLETSVDIKAKITEWLEEVRRAQVTGEHTRIDDINAFANLFNGMSGFATFFLNNGKYVSVSPIRQQEGRLDRSDIRRLEELAGQIGSKSPKDRAEHFLSAAKVALDLRSELDDSNLLYQDLCRSFTSSGDYLVLENGQLDAIREWYCEALKIYDRDRKKDKAAPDAAWAMIRYLYSTRGLKYIPIVDSKIPRLDETLKDVLEIDEPDKAFDAIAYLTYHSLYAADRIFDVLYHDFREPSVDYLVDKGCDIPQQPLTLEMFKQLWKTPQRKRSDEASKAAVELSFIGKVEITSASTAAIELRIGALNSLKLNPPTALDKQRIEHLQDILEATLDLCQQEDFGERQRFGNRVEMLCQKLLDEIKDQPTRLSVESIYPVVETVQTKTKEYMEEIDKSSVPQLTIRLAKIGAIDASYVLDEQQNIVVQIVIMNKTGSSPAESLQLVAQTDEKFFHMIDPEVRLLESLRGGDQRTLKLPLHVLDQGLNIQTFSLPIQVKYKTLSGEEVSVAVSFPIRLYPVDKFVEIYNPYSVAGAVEDAKMFKGRDAFITSLANGISRPEFKAIMIYGQKRTGKTSILYHLEKKMREIKNIFIVDVGSIGGYLDSNSKIPMFSRIFWAILDNFSMAVEKEERIKQQHLGLSFPTYEAFCDDPLRIFQEILNRFKSISSSIEGWEKTRVVVLIDEFSYLYKEILDGRKKALDGRKDAPWEGLDENFMHTWKALIERRTFCTVMVGQDVMPKFMGAYANDFNVVPDVRVDYLEREHAISLIDEPIRRGDGPQNSRYVEGAIERILELTAGNPYYIQLFCHRLVEYMNFAHAEWVTDADVNQVLDNWIRGKVDPLNEDRFENLIDSGDTSADAISKEDAKKVLQAIAVNSRRTTLCSRNSLAYLEGQTDAPVKDILEDLERRQVIKCEEGKYYSILVVLFKEWLIAHKQGDMRDF